jgi:hypothetical protein
LCPQVPEPGPVQGRIKLAIHFSQCTISSFVSFQIPQGNLVRKKRLGKMKNILYLRSINHQKQSNLKKTFYLITEKNYNNDNTLDVGTFIEKIILSTESEDFKEFSKESPKGTLKETFDNYENHFMFYFDDVLREQRQNSHFEEYQIYKHLLLDETQYEMLTKQMKDIPTRKVSVNELV